MTSWLIGLTNPTSQLGEVQAKKEKEKKKKHLDPTDHIM